MSNFYQLKSHPNRTLYDHLKCVAESCTKIAKNTYPLIKTTISEHELTRAASIIGATHDLGKATQFFQDYISGNVPSDPLLKSHSLISSLFASWVLLNDPQISEKNKDTLCIASSLVIQGHHGSLKRPTSYLRVLDTFSEQEIFSRQVASLPVKEVRNISKNLGLGNFDLFLNSWESHYVKLARMLIKSSNHLKVFIDSREPYFLINLLYSVLLDADRMDVACLQFSREPIEIKAASNFVKTLEYKEFDYINRYRNLLFDNLERSSKTVSLDRKIFSITAQTGLGKTLSSVNFALNLRERILKHMGYTPRIIYVAPFITILDQNVKVFQNIFGSDIQSSKLLMHHHLSPLNYIRNVVDEQKIESYSTTQSELLIQGWNSELIVTTFIQFFDTIFGRFTSQLRRLHNLIGNIIILDEVQSIPFEYWDSVRNALLFLSQNFRCTIIFMTATQPLIFCEGEIQELVPPGLLNIPERVTFNDRSQQECTLTEFCIEMNTLIEKHSNKSLLIELNTIKSAIDVYRSIIPSDGVFFLSSQIIPKHRKPRIDSIKINLSTLRPTILVSTQVVEAGVDLDFDIAVRDIGPIDSIVQTAGRCNRNGLKSSDDSLFFIYKLVNEHNHQFARQVYGRVAIDVAESILEDNEDILDLVEPYYNEIRNRRSNRTSAEINTAIHELNYENIQENFQLINESYKVPVFVEFDEVATEIWQRFVNLMDIANGRPSRTNFLQIKNAMEQYLIGISEDDVTAAGLEQVSGIFKIDITEIERLYDETTGFHLD